MLTDMGRGNIDRERRRRAKHRASAEPTRPGNPPPASLHLGSIYMERNTDPTKRVQVRCTQCGQRFETQSPGGLAFADGLESSGDTRLEFNVSCPNCGSLETETENFEVNPVDGTNITISAIAGDSTESILRSILTAPDARTTPVAAIADQIETALPQYKVFAHWLRKNPWFMTLAVGVMMVLTQLLIAEMNSASPPTTRQHVDHIINNGNLTIVDDNDR